MPTVLFVIAALLAVLIAFAGAFYLPARRQGRFATKVGETALKSEKVRTAMENQALKALDRDPEMVERVLDEMGASREMRRAAEQFKTLRPEQRQAMMAAAKTGDVRAVMQAQATAGRQSTRKTGAQKARAKAARKARKNNRRR
jgi:hypothetical protein